jgi:hypothetical protein
MSNAKFRRLDDLFVMRKGDRMAVCALHTHDLGWVMKVRIDISLLRSPDIIGY